MSLRAISMHQNVVRIRDNIPASKDKAEKSRFERRAQTTKPTRPPSKYQRRMPTLQIRKRRLRQALHDLLASFLADEGPIHDNLADAIRGRDCPQSV
jgi:hypothetical protein